jgi:L-histidine N-alpha-methyltransferase
VTDLGTDARRGLTARPKAIPPKWFYDDRGSALFEEITRLDEYYPTRRERSILVERSPDIARLTEARTLVELGSGTSEKTRLLIDALRGHGNLERFVPFDVSEQTLLRAAAAIEFEYPDIAVQPFVGDFTADLHSIARHPRQLFVLLGGTIGNLLPDARTDFLRSLAGVLAPGDFFLLGTDLVKDTARLEAAYNDSRGITAEFNKNLLRVLNRDLDADFDLDAFEHVARFDPGPEWIEMGLRSTRDQTVRVRGLELVVGFVAGEEMRTEISAKFRRRGIAAELAAAGLELVAWWTDPDGDFALSLSRPV